MIKILYLLIVMLLFSSISGADILIYDPPLKEVKTMGIFKSGDTINKPSCPANMTGSIQISISSFMGSTDGTTAYPVTGSQVWAENINCDGEAVQGGYFYCDGECVFLTEDYDALTPEQIASRLVKYFSGGTNCRAWRVRGQTADLENGVSESKNAIKLSVATYCCPQNSPNCE